MMWLGWGLKMSTFEQNRFKTYLVRDKPFLAELYLSTNNLNTKRVLNFAADTKLDTLIKFLHYLSTGAIKIKKTTFETIKRSHIGLVKKNFETKSALNRLLHSDREEKLKIVLKLAPSLPFFLYPLFNEQDES